MLKPSNNLRVIYYINLLVRSPDFVHQQLLLAVTKVCTSSCAELWRFLPMNASCELIEMASVYLEHQEIERRWVKGPLAIETIEPNKKKPKEFSQKDVKWKGSTKSHDIARSWWVEILLQANLDDVRRFSMSFEALKLNCIVWNSSKQWQPWETVMFCVFRWREETPAPVARGPMPQLSW